MVVIKGFNKEKQVGIEIDGLKLFSRFNSFTFLVDKIGIKIVIEKLEKWTSTIDFKDITLDILKIIDKYSQ